MDYHRTTWSPPGADYRFELQLCSAKRPFSCGEEEEDSDSTPAVPPPPPRLVYEMRGQVVNHPAAGESVMSFGGLLAQLVHPNAHTIAPQHAYILLRVLTAS